MIGKKINQLATELAPVSTDLTIIGDPISGVSKKITLAQLGAIFSGAVSFYTTIAGFPATGDINVIYCAKDTQKLYLWSGSAYTEVFPSQALLDTYQLRSEKGVSNGYASLDSSGKVPISQLPSSIMEYKGTWSASTNTPTLANGTGDTGDVYICNSPGSVNFGAGAITFAVGDYVIYSGTIWQRSSGAVGTVTSVAASITGNAIGITGSPVTTSGTLAFAFAGTGAQYIKGDGTLATFPSTIAQAERLITEVYNSTGATLTKGTIVYINGGQGNLPTVTKALATGDSTSAQTFGVVQADITNNNNGYVVVAGKLSDLDTQAYTEGTQLYLSSTTAGAWTSTKQYAPAHLVYVGIVVRSHPTQGIVEIKIQNGYELDELHNVAAQTPTNNDGLFWEASTSLWKNKSISTILGGTPVTGSGTLYALTKWGFTSGAIINSNLYDTGSVIYNNNATAGAFAVQFNGNATSGMSYGLLINAGSDANDIALRIQNVSSTSEYFFVYGDGKVKMNNIPNATTDTDTFLVSDGGFIKYRTGAQLLSDIGGQAALTNPVTGTGTTNYLPKFTGTSSIGNSVLQETSGNIQLDNTSAVYIANSSSTSYYGGLSIRQSGTERARFAANSTEGAYIYSPTFAGFSILSDAGTFLRLNASGNLGLGVTPSAWASGLSVFQGSSSLSVGNSGNGGMNVLANAYYGSNWTYVSSAQASWYQQIDGKHAWHIAPSGTAGNAISFTQAMTLNASGNLSIGNTNDTYKLDVSGTGRFTGDVSVIKSSDASFIVNNTSASGKSYRLVSKDDGKFYIQNTGVADLFNIASTGAATFSSSVTQSASDSRLLGGDTAGRYIISNSDTSAYMAIYGSASATANQIGLITNSLITFNTGSGYAERMRISSTGNVGIGTTSPTQGKLVVSGGVANSIATIAASISGGSNALNIGDDGTNAVLGVANSGTDMVFLKRVAGVYSEAMRITSGGNVGIGTTSPSAVLEVAGISANTDFRISRTVSSSTYFYIKAPGGSPSTSTMGVNGVDVMALNASGFVGIGTTSPTVKFEVAGSGSIGYFRNPSSTAATTFITVINANNTSNGLVMAHISDGTGYFGTQNSADLRLVTGDTERMRIKSNGIINLSNVPSSSAGLSSGDIYKTVAGVLMIV